MKQKLLHKLWLLAAIGLLPAASAWADDVAQIGTTEYATLQAALDAAHEMTGDVTVELKAVASGYAVVHQKAGLNLTIEGSNNTLHGQIIIDGDGRAAGTETLTIQNVEFNDNKDNFCTGTDAFVLVPSCKSSGTPYYTGKYNYAHNITIDGCSFTSTSSSLNVVGFKSASSAGCYNLVMSNISGTNLHSLAQLTGTTGAAFTKCNVSESKSFIAINGGTGGYEVSDCQFTSKDGENGYGIRLKSNSGAVVTLEENTLSAATAIQLGENDASSGSINVVSGTYTGDIVYSESSSGTGQIVVSGGTFEGDVVYSDASEEGHLEISGGTFGSDVSDYVADGFELQNNGDGTYSAQELPDVAQIGETKYKTLEAAFAAAADGAMITVLADCAGNGIIVPQGKYTAGLTVDYDGKTYTVDGATVGSTGTETNGFQLLKDNKITFKNGTITSTKAKILIQNYSDLTLENMTLTLNNPSYASAYTLSNNNGEIVIDNTTINANPSGGFAFDVCRYASYPSVSVTVTGSSVINGDVEIFASNGDAKDGFSLTLTSGSMTGDVVVDATAATAMEATPEKAEVTKAAAFTQDAPDGYEWTDNGDGTSSLTELPDVAQIGTTGYKTLEAAFSAAADGSTITLVSDCAGNGIKVAQGKYATGLTVDFGGFTYTVDGATVGSTGTETNGFQLLKDNKITFKNGTITSTKAKILIQNYSDLTLEGMTLTLNNPSYASAYTLSNNNGDIVIDNTTINANPAGGFAFDVCRYASYPSVSVTVTGSSVINGDVEIFASNGDAKDGFSLTLTLGSMTGDVVVDATAATAMEATPEKAEVTKAAAFTQDAPDGYEWTDNGDGTSSLAAITDVVLEEGVAYTRTTDLAGVDVSYARKYDSDRVNKYQGWFLPFDYTITAADLEKFKFYKIDMIAHSSTKGGEVEDANLIWIFLAKVNEGELLKANKPYVYVPLGEVDYTFSAANATLKAKTSDVTVDCSTTTELYQFYGVYENTSPTETNKFYYMNIDGEVSWGDGTGSVTVGPYRWIMTVTAKNGEATPASYARSIRFTTGNGEGDATGIQNVSENNSEIDGYFTLDGVKVGNPENGVYLMRLSNGNVKKVFVK